MRVGISLLFLALLGSTVTSCGGLPGRFPCGAGSCERGAEYCLHLSGCCGFPDSFQCKAMAGACDAMADDVCACIAAEEETTNAPCESDGDGAVEVTYVEG